MKKIGVPEVEIILLVIDIYNQSLNVIFKNGMSPSIQ